MTTVVYNNVVLRDCETMAFDQDIIYDESKTDVMYSKFRIKIASSIVAIRYGASGEDVGVTTPYGATVVQKMHDIQARLSECRKDFWMLVDSCVTDEKVPYPVVLDQPLLVACGEAFQRELVPASPARTSTPTTSTHSDGPPQKVEQTPLSMSPHPFSQQSFTMKYGEGDQDFPKWQVLDCENGPKPKSVSVKEIVGGRAIRVIFEIVICRPICIPFFNDNKPVILGADIKPSAHVVLSNRYSIEETKDENWKTSRSVHGTLRVTHSDFMPHAYRYLCIPPLADGYKRIRQSFVSDPTDLVLKYRIDDEQRHAAPPHPAVTMRGHHAESSVGSTAARSATEFQIRLTGPPGVDKQQLIGAAGKMTINRIKGLGKKHVVGEKDYGMILKNASIVDIIHEPTIEMRVRAEYTSADYRSLALRIQEMGKDLKDIGTRHHYASHHASHASP